MISYKFLLNCLINIKIDKNDKNQLTHLFEYYYKNNEYELSLIKEFNQNYLSSKCFWWLTRYCFISKTINQLIMKKSFKLLFLMRFFFQDIFKHIQLNENFKKDSFHLYTSRIIPKNQFELFNSSIGCLISVNNFLFTNFIRKKTLSYLKKAHILEDFYGILFDINVHSEMNSNKFYSNISSLSYLSGEQIILFMLGSIFKIINIEYYEKNISIIYLEFQNKSLIDINLDIDLIQIGYSLIDTNKYLDAFFYFNYLIEIFNQDLFESYNALAQISLKQNQYDLSLEFYQKLIQLNYPNQILSIYNNIAFVYLKKSDFQQALKYYQMILQILLENFKENPSFIIESYNNMALIYKLDHQYNLALDYYKKILNIYDELYLNKTICSDKALLYYNIGLIYSHLNQFDSSLEYYKKSLNIYKEILPKNHYRISIIYENLANIYCDKNDLNQSFVYYEKAKKIYQNLFASKHPDILQIEIIIKRIKSKLNIN